MTIDSPVPGYDIVDISWEVEITPGGEKVILNGTVQEVYAQLIELYPEYKANFPITTHTEASMKRNDDSHLSKRDSWVCGNFPQCSMTHIDEGISYLYGVQGSPTNGPGPGNCGRVSCSYNSAIYWCNDVWFSSLQGIWYALNCYANISFPHHQESKSKDLAWVL
jgi:hypothetical protein